MTDNDADLLQQFVRDQSQDAFTALVQRHVNLVYSTALRHVHSPELCQDIAQSVFADLARNAARLEPNTILSAWLYQVTRRTAIDVLRRESRRQARERVAVEIAAMNAPSLEWKQIEPLLDDAMEALDDTDRTAVLLRFFENRSLRDVGAILGTSDDAAQKRVSRSVERLREFFATHGVVLGTGALVPLISSHAVHAAPAGLASAISTAAFAGTAVASTTVTAAVTAAKGVAMTALQKTLVVAALSTSIGVGIYEGHKASTFRHRALALQQERAPLDEQIRTLQRDFAAAASNASTLRDENERLKQDTAELLRLRNMAGTARRATAEAEQLRGQLARQTNAPGNSLVTGAMADAMQQAVVHTRFIL